MLPAVSLLLCLSLVAASNVKITELSVPKSVKLGEDIELRCQYALHEREEKSMFYVKWWRTPLEDADNYTVIYQRLGTHPAQSQGGFKIVGNDTIKLVDAQPKNSGKYTCEVSNIDEARQSENLVVYSSGSGPELNWTSVDDGPDDKDVVVSCSASDVTPEPELEITIDGKEVNPEEVILSELPDGFYSISVNATLEEINVGSEIRCELFYKNRNVTHEPYVDIESYQGSGAEVTTPEALEDSTEWGNVTTVVPDGGNSILLNSSWLLLVAIAALAQPLLSY